MYPLIFVVQALLAVWVAVNILRGGPRPLPRILSLAFLGSFVASSGWYLLLLPFPLGFVGIGNLLYLIALVLLAVPALLVEVDVSVHTRLVPLEK